MAVAGNFVNYKTKGYGLGEWCYLAYPSYRWLLNVGRGKLFDPKNKQQQQQQQNNNNNNNNNA